MERRFCLTLARTKMDEMTGFPGFKNINQWWFSPVQTKTDKVRNLVNKPLRVAGMSAHNVHDLEIGRKNEYLPEKRSKYEMLRVIS